MKEIHVIMSGLSSCSDCDEAHGFLEDGAEARAACERLNAAGIASSGTRFFVNTLRTFDEAKFLAEQEQ